MSFGLLILNKAETFQFKFPNLFKHDSSIVFLSIHVDVSIIFAVRKNYLPKYRPVERGRQRRWRSCATVVMPKIVIYIQDVSQKAFG